MKKLVFLLLVAIAASVAAYFEFRTSYLQSRFFTAYAEKLTYTLGEGSADYIVFPTHGPYNYQQGYSRLPDFQKRLEKRGYSIAQQARFSPALVSYAKRGGNPPYDEKQQTGLEILDEDQNRLYLLRQPGRIYRNFSDIPQQLVDALLFIENRELLLNDNPRRNPAVEWDRLAEAVFSQLASPFLPDLNTMGGSTLATQLEKYRYSPNGITVDAREKLRQMVSASVRTYRHGELTLEARQRILRDYLNSTPLSGRLGFGEIQGLGDGLWAWYGIEFDRANYLLSAPSEVEALEEKSQVFKSALSLMLSQRRPSFYLLEGREALEQLTNSYLRLMANAGVISPRLRDAALAQPLTFRQGKPVLTPPPFISRKAVNSTRMALLNLLAVENLYTLDRLDLRITSSIANDAQDEVSAALQNLTQPEPAKAAGLIGERLLREDQLKAVSYSFLLYEATAEGNLLRIQTDNINMPFDMNHGSKLDLGSTAKLRTLITYLEVIEIVYNRYARMTVPELRVAAEKVSDPLSLWTLSYLISQPDAPLMDVLEAAMLRQYSASPNERFYTASGLHSFSNFERKDNTRVMTVSEALTRSVNLVFIRMMRDIARFHTNEIPAVKDLLENPADPRRQAYLQRFADLEGKEFLRNFYKVYAKLDDNDKLTTLGSRTRTTPYRLAMAFRSVRPDASPVELATFMRSRLGEETPTETEIARLHGKYDPYRFNSADRAYLAKVHPLELWLVKYLLANSAASLSDVFSASEEERQTAYAWLFKSQKVKAQNTRIRNLVEQEAFRAIHKQWRQLGYPFSSLVPSYATALGASADRPLALAELMGIIVNDGVRQPLRQMDDLMFAEGTPYETLFRFDAMRAERVLSPEIARTVRKGLMGIVESGTARRLQGVFVDANGNRLPVGGKTGTGDHRNKRYAAGGRLISEEVVNRNAIFMFFIGERHFGVILAHVGGNAAKDFTFTSALAAQFLKALQPSLQQLLVSPVAGGDNHTETPANDP